jgi:hypothetical protein
MKHPLDDIPKSAWEWNERYPVGTIVRFRDASNDQISRTRSEAWELGGGVPVVAIEGRSGGVGVSFLTALDPASLDGCLRISLERLRQIGAEGYDAKHDDGHSVDLSLIDAAIAYCESAHGRPVSAANEWPWPDGFKPTTPIRDLAKAGALIAAEIDRRLRAGETA